MPATVDFFKRHLNPVFIETGTYLGEGVTAAINAGFTNIRSVELSEKLHADNVRRFAAKTFIKIYHGSSEDQLANMIADIHQPITFWLDAHYSGGITAKGKQMSPILQEIAVIAAHPIKAHTILIDDRRFMGTEVFDFVTETQICDAIRRINPAFQFSHETGSNADPMFADDVLVARL